MNDTCENCGAYFTPSKFIPSVTQGCPNCGHRPYMNQPYPTESDMNITTGPDASSPDHKTDGQWQNPYELGTIFEPTHPIDKMANLLEDPLIINSIHDLLQRYPDDETIQWLNGKLENRIPEPGQDELGSTPDEIGGNPHAEGMLGEIWKSYTNAEGGRDEYASVNKNRKWASIMKVANELIEQTNSYPDRQIMEYMRMWVYDTFGQAPPDLTDQEILNTVNSQYEGGIPGFLETYYHVSSPIPSSTPNDTISEIQSLPEAQHPLGEFTGHFEWKPTTKIATPYDMGDIDVAEFETVQVIPAGPSTVEVEREGETTPLILQHDNPQILEEAKDKLSNTKIAQWQALLEPVMGMLAGGGEAGASSGLMGGLARGALMGQGMSGGAHSIENMGKDILGLGNSPIPAPVTNDLQSLAHENIGEVGNEIEGDIGNVDEALSNLIPFDSDLGKAFTDALPSLLHFFDSEESGSSDPHIQKFIILLNEHSPDALNSEPSPEDQSLLDQISNLKREHEAKEMAGPQTTGEESLAKEAKFISLAMIKHALSIYSRKRSSIHAALKESVAIDPSQFSPYDPEYENAASQLGEVLQGAGYQPGGNRGVPAEEMSFGDPMNFQDIPLNNYLSDPELGHLIGYVDEFLYENPGITPDQAIYTVSEQMGVPFDELKTIFDTSILQELHTLGPQTMMNPEIAPHYEAPNFPPNMGELPPAPRAAKTGADTWTQNDLGFENPTTVYYKRVETEPDTVDPHEIDDTDNEHWEKSFYTDEADAGGSQSKFPVDSEVGQAFLQAYPAMTEWHDNPRPDNPDIQRLISVLRHQTQSKKASYPDTVPPPEPTNFPTVNEKQDPESLTTCPYCGSKYDGIVCPQCNQTTFMGWNTQVPGNPQQLLDQQNTQNLIQMNQLKNIKNQTQASTKQAGQGPHSAEQFAMVFQYLRENGRENEAANLLENPDAYGPELAEIQRKGTIPTPPEMGQMAPPPTQGPPPMPPPGPQPQGGGAGGAPGGTMQASTKRSDNIAERCPKCKSFTTSVTSKDGDCRCHSCNHNWNMAPLFKDDIKSTSSVLAAASDFPPWETSNGQPLLEGQTYEMYSGQYPVPNIVRINHVTPNNLDYTMLGLQEGLSYDNTITKETANMDKISFVPYGEEAQSTVSTQPIEMDTDASATMGTPYTGWPEQDNLSIQASRKESIGPMAQPDTGAPSPILNPQPSPGGEPAICIGCNSPMMMEPGKGPICPTCQGQQTMAPYGTVSKTSGRDYLPHEQKELINEPGMARNLDDLDLSNTHYIDADNILEKTFLW